MTSQNATPTYDTLEELETVANEVSQAIPSIKDIGTEFSEGFWVLEFTDASLLKLVEVLSLSLVSDEFLNGFHQELGNLHGVTYGMREGEARIKIPELSVLNLAIWVKQNSAK
jgi:hypothetical protein